MLYVSPQWPLYVVLTGSGAGAPLYVEDVFTITSNFEFACCVVSRLNGASSIVRVTRHSNFMCVKPQATHSIRFLDQRCARHKVLMLGLGTVCSDLGRPMRCQICIKVDGMWSKKELVSVRASAELAPLHLARCYPYFVHESLDFDRQETRTHETAHEQAWMVKLSSCLPPFLSLQYDKILCTAYSSLTACHSSVDDVLALVP